MVTVTNLGTASGLPLARLLEDLTKAQMQRIVPMTNEKTTCKGQLTAFGIFQSSLAKMAESSTTLKQAATISTTRVGANSAFTAEIKGKPNVGSYSIEVTQLAQAQSLRSSNQTSNTAMLGTSGGAGTRTISITQPGYSAPLVITLDDTQTSLNSIRDAINKQASSRVSAEVIKGDDTNYYLNLAAKETGTKSAMTITVTGDNNLAAILDYPSSDANQMVETATAEDAELTINGIPVTRSNNTITDIPEGVTLTLNAASTPGKSEQLNITRDTTPMSKAVQDFVDNYNALQTTIDSLTKYTPVNVGEKQAADNGELVGDSTVRNIQVQLRNMLNGTEDNKGIRMLNDLGITFALSGRLEVDNVKLQKTIADKPDQVVAFFAGNGTTTGFAVQVDKLMSMTLDKESGTLHEVTEDINKNILDIEDQIARTTRLIDSQMEALTERFVELDKLVARLNKTSEFLTQQFKLMHAATLGEKK